ncbi:hypothetical protein HDV04_002363 [Boothiomyces sp. JEL0838]|nr:hypothetical protein HDV04_002348 [Boothiomyces sp. JEL0838]KAJ3313202.1 hypothetical protein HDV04_002363 [Boothiomyces sp. JEL0838]
MKSIVIPKAGPPSILQYADKPIPEPSGSEIRIKVEAAGLNFADIMARKGLYPDAPSFPTTMGYEVAGVVDKTGPDATELLNKRVVAFTRFNSQQEYAVTPKSYTFVIPDSLSFIDAASILVVYTTAWVLIYEMGGLRKDQTVLIQNAGGSVGLAAIDIALHLGAKTIGTASGRKHDFLKSHGLHHAIDYRTENVRNRVLAITEGKGVDLIIDPIGGKEWNVNYSLLKKTGRLGMFGASSLSDLGEMNIISKAFAFLNFLFNMPKWSPLKLMDDNKGVFGVNLGHMFDMLEEYRGAIQGILDGVESGWVRPVVDSVFAFEDVGAAHQYMEDRKNTGKIILVPTKESASSWKKQA